jgi:hypothetical protein
MGGVDMMVFADGFFKVAGRGGATGAREVAVVGNAVVASVKRVGVCNDAATVWPMLTFRRMMIPS